MGLAAGAPEVRHAGGIPTRELLDAVVPDRPVYLVNRDHHGAWVNSRALELAGIDRRSADPVDGRIERDADGVPNGMLQEGAAQLVGRLLPAVTAADRLAGLLRAQRLLHSLGITAWQDALLGSFNGMGDPSGAYLAASPVGSSPRGSAAHCGGTGRWGPSRSTTCCGGGRCWRHRRCARAP
jgi:predicted amidohydrolase YtcJ